MLSGNNSHEGNVHTREQDLLLTASAGDRQAFATLYTEYFPRLYRYVFFTIRSRADAEEIIQDIFLKVWERKETLAAIRSFEDYLFIMARHRLFDQAKQQASRQKAELRSCDVLPDAAGSAEG